MFGRIWSFVKRHRKKIVFVSLTVSGAIWLGRYAHRRLKEFQEKDTTECLAHIRRQHHFDSNQRTCNTTVLSVLPCLREALCQKLNTELLTEQLRSKPANKLEIWEKLKIMSLTRTVVAVYSCCILVVFIRVQLNILGGYMYIDSQQNGFGLLNEGITVTSDIQKHYLAGIQYIFEQGLDNLISDIQRIVTEVVGSLSLRDLISPSTVQDMIFSIRRQMECNSENGYHDVVLSNLNRYMMSDGDCQASAMSREEITINRLNIETKDMIESSDFHTVMNVCLDSGFTRLVNKIAEYFSPSTKSDNTLPEVRSEVLGLPFAKVIPIINGMVHTILADAPNPFLQDLLLKDQVKDFAANVYEAFCQMSDNKCSID